VTNAAHPDDRSEPGGQPAAPQDLAAANAALGAAQYRRAYTLYSQAYKRSSSEAAKEDCKGSISIANRRGPAFAQLRSARGTSRRRLMSRLPLWSVEHWVVASPAAGASIGAGGSGAASGESAARR